MPTAIHRSDLNYKNPALKFICDYDPMPSHPPPALSWLRWTQHVLSHQSDRQNIDKLPLTRCICTSTLAPSTKRMKSASYCTAHQISDETLALNHPFLGRCLATICGPLARAPQSPMLSRSEAYNIRVNSEVSCKRLVERNVERVPDKAARTSRVEITPPCFAGR